MQKKKGSKKGFFVEKDTIRDFYFGLFRTLFKIRAFVLFSHKTYVYKQYYMIYWILSSLYVDLGASRRKKKGLDRILSTHLQSSKSFQYKKKKFVTRILFGLKKMLNL